MEIAAGALPCDAWHHYYHYQSSAQYLWLARTCMALGLSEDAKNAYERALFQDHFNDEALAGREALKSSSPLTGEGRGGGEKTSGGKATIPPSLTLPRKGGGNIKYDKHPAFDLEFLSLIGQLPDDATRPHDEGVRALALGNLTEAMALFDTAIALNAHHSNSFFARGKCHFLSGDFEKARADFIEAVRLSHQKHDSYHRAASEEHLQRGRGFLKLGKLDLAINDFTKALDLHRKNKDALAARAQAYRAKGSVQLAEMDERESGRVGE